ncbi:S1 family peptidase [Bythopirellula polymerisocia]|uniref:Periplasmic serine endoprotease DegP n=1 Tax=Bythopirellula polymerisocia TaxID=2528003 RepID=A0A5C6C9H1_9BACT|nr:serine protease [Bythopirellula polymerisocia]TWU20808.1 Periplasmic serine endoprotease DegP precursor [Bythopirellula polymerisocia]
MINLLSEYWRHGARYRITIAGTILCALVAIPLQARADFSSANFGRIWQEEIGSKIPQSQQSISNQTPLGTLPYPSTIPTNSAQPHPAVVRVVVPEGEATSFGSGTLVDVREKFGLVITNWHVVRDAKGPIEVIFPNGLTSKARALKVDPDWDLAALVIWHPQVKPVKIAASAPQPGDLLTICGYGPGIYRSATGRCTQYYSPQANMPQQMVELDVEARQGDSGGPIFNDRGELAGVLFGAGQGTTLGSFGGRVESFLATLAPNIGGQSDEALVQARTQNTNPDSKVATTQTTESTLASSEDDWQSSSAQLAELRSEQQQDSQQLTPPEFTELDEETHACPDVTDPDFPANDPYVATEQPLFEQVKTALAAIGIVALAVMVLKAAG